MPELTPKKIKDTHEPLTQFLSADLEGKLSICAYYDSGTNKAERLPRVRDMLSNADTDELQRLSAFTAAAKLPDSDFLACLDRGIQIKGILLSLPTTDTPLALLSTITDMGRFHEFHNLFSQPLLDGDADKTKMVSEKIVAGYETIGEATMAVRSLQTIQHSLRVASPFLTELSQALRNRTQSDAPSQRQHMFAKKSVQPVVQRAKEEIVGMTNA